MVVYVLPGLLVVKSPIIGGLSSNGQLEMSEFYNFPVIFSNNT